MSGGSIQNMMNTLKNNRILLATKRGLFKTKFQILREDYKTATNIIIKGNIATKEELSEIRKKVLQERKRENKIQLTILALIFLVISSFTYSMLTNRVNNTPLHLEKSNELTQVNYNESMAMGQQLLDDKKWFYAASNFENALLQIPNDFSASYNLTLAYCELCYTKNQACEKTNSTINELIKNNPNSDDLKILKAKYLE